VAVIVSAEQLAEIRRHAEAVYPHEGCGLMGGATDGVGRRVVRLVPVPNARDDSPRNRYLIEPEEFLRAQATLEREGLDVVGVYHSHPDHPARPSAFDEEHAWPRLSYVIVGVTRGAAADARSWVLADDRDGFVEESIIIEERVAT
jgi:proteasome lid subunit RPN8/RPN11